MGEVTFIEGEDLLGEPVNEGSVVPQGFSRFAGQEAVEAGSPLLPLRGWWRQHGHDVFAGYCEHFSSSPLVERNASLLTSHGAKLPLQQLVAHVAASRV